MRTFLTAEWRHLLMLNYVVDPDVLRPLVPRGVELDPWEGNSYVSMVGFRFERARVCGIRVPFHENFEEVNLRFYVRRSAPEGWRRGVAFIKEIVPRELIARVARFCYKEPYTALTMRHSLDLDNGALRSGGKVSYEWRHQGRWESLRATVAGTARVPPPGSEEQFITEHYWGYTAQPNGGCKEYQVEHAPWSVWRVESPKLDCQVEALYGADFAQALGSAPRSAFVADGSSIKVGMGTMLR